MLTRKLRQRFWKMFDSWGTAKLSRQRHRPTFQPQLEVLETRLLPAQTWYVAGLGDAGQGMTNEGDLRYCMNKAQNGDTIVFGVSGTISLNSALPVITKNITINGAGQNVEIWGGGVNEIFTVNAGVTAEIDNLSIDDGFSPTLGAGLFNAGTLTLKTDTFLSNQATQGGGAICNDTGAKLDMLGVSVNSNSTQGDGGGILNYGDLFCDENTTIVQNKATTAGSSGGGGIANEGGFLQFGSGQVTGNTAANVGGGIYQTAGTVTLTGGVRTLTIQGNKALIGGGLFATSGSLTIRGGVTISTNKATGGAGSDGGGICLVSGSLTITAGVTISNNQADIWGGGIYLGGGTASIDDGTIENNTVTNGSAGGIFSAAKSLKLFDEFIYHNTASQNGGGLYVDAGVATVSGKSMVNNHADTSNGGGIYAYLGTLHLLAVSVSGNTAASNGGGMYIVSGTVTVAGGRFDDNVATNNGGGICNNTGKLSLSSGAIIGIDNSAKQGGGLYLATGSVTTFVSCTVKGNQASSGQGIGVYWQNKAAVNTVGLTDNDDPFGQPFKGP